MSGFRDIALPSGFKGYPTSGAPRWSTTIIYQSSGHTQRNQNWQHPLQKYTMADAVRDQATYEAVKRHWYAMRGPLYSFPFRDPLDFASQDLDAPDVAPTITGLDQALGVADGLTREFQLVKTYDAVGVDEEVYTRTIELPVLSSVVVLLNGLDPGTSAPTLPGGPYTYEVTRPGGKVVFDHDLTAAVVVTAGFLFEVPARFESDDAFEGIVRNFRVSGFASVTLVEERLC